jgi:hypothetical protein
MEKMAFVSNINISQRVTGYKSTYHLVQAASYLSVYPQRLKDK